ncbi:MAG: zinc ribbon domain-containing protein [Candidatus Omnitrophica bacterium]|nr:zinc ribbon domain-containing protein [Candidatus Omnitrophota bacterium]
MPLYEYRCLDCAATFEYLLRQSNEEVACPRCRGLRLQRLISTFALAGESRGSSRCGGCSTHNCKECSG